MSPWQFAFVDVYSVTLYGAAPPLQSIVNTAFCDCVTGFGVTLRVADSVPTIVEVVDVDVELVLLVSEVDVVESDVELDNEVDVDEVDVVLTVKEVDVDVEVDVVVDVVVGWLTVTRTAFVYTCCELESVTWAQ